KEAADHLILELHGIGEAQGQLLKALGSRHGAGLLPVARLEQRWDLVNMLESNTTLPTCGGAEDPLPKFVTGHAAGATPGTLSPAVPPVPPAVTPRCRRRRRAFLPSSTLTSAKGGLRLTYHNSGQQANTIPRPPVPFPTGNSRRIPLTAHACLAASGPRCAG